MYSSHYNSNLHASQRYELSRACHETRETTLVLDRRSIDLSGAQEKEGNFHYKNFLGASK